MDVFGRGMAGAAMVNGDYRFLVVFYEYSCLNLSICLARKRRSILIIRWEFESISIPSKRPSSSGGLSLVRMKLGGLGCFVFIFQFLLDVFTLFFFLIICS